MKAVISLAIAIALVPVVQARFDTGALVLCSQPVALPLSLLFGIFLAIISYLIFPGVMGWVTGMLFLIPLQMLFDFRAHITEGIRLWEIPVDLILAFSYAGAIELFGGLIIGMLLGQITGVLLCLPITLPLSIVRSLL